MRFLSLCSLFLLVGHLALAGAGPDGSISGEIEALKRRVADLENQNRRMEELLSAMEARLKLVQPAPAVAGAAPASTAPPSAAPKAETAEDAPG